MDWSGFPIFPEGGLDSSVITTVWVGVWVMSLFNLRLGWGYSGLVVPGYLVPLLIQRPWAAAVIVAEAVVTYLLVWLVSEKISKLGLWHNLFGRDRFFAIILTSIGVRLAGESFVLPALAEWLATHHGATLDYRSHLHSFGLVIVALLANQLWKPGLVRGLGAFAVTLAVTFVAVRYVLIPLTNFNVGSLGYMYEDVASSWLASPKSYVLLIIAAGYASYVNLRYGWDTNGILVPSLLALMVFQPGKLLTTFVESWVVLAVAGLLLSTPWLRSRGLANASKMLVFWNVSFGYKMVLGFTLALVAPEFKVSDAYGFSYLIPTLLAIRMHDRGLPVRLPLVTLWISLVGATVASSLGWALTWVEGPNTRTGVSYEIDEEDVTQRLRDEKRELYTDLPDRTKRLTEGVVSRRGDLARWLKKRKERVASRPLENAAEGGLAARDLRKPRLGELLLFDREVLTPLFARPEDSELAVVSWSAALLGYELIHFRDVSGEEFLILSERPESQLFWGTYVLRRAAVEPSLAVQVPHPLFEAGTWEQGVDLFFRLRGDALLLAGAHPHSFADVDVVLERNRGHLFNLFHQVWMREAPGREQLAVQVRGFNPSASMTSVDALVAAAGEAPRDAMQHLQETLERHGLSWRAVDGSPETAGYDADRLFQARYPETRPEKGLAVLWLSSGHRARARSWAAADDVRFAALDVATVKGDLVAVCAASAESGVAREEELAELLRQYVRSRDVVALRRVQRQWPELTLYRLRDRGDRGSFLVVADGEQHALLVAPLDGVDSSLLALR